MNPKRFFNNDEKNPYFPYQYVGDKRRSQDPRFEQARKQLSKYVEGAGIRDCKYGCGTRIFYHDLFDAWLEFKTNIHHGLRRCRDVKDERKKDIDNKNSRFREEIIEMIQVIIETKVPKKASKEEELYTIITELGKDEIVPTSHELVAAIYPKEVSVDVNGKKIVTENGQQRVYNTLNRIRKREENQSFAPYSLRSAETKNFHYADMKNEEHAKPVDIKLTKMGEGFFESKEKLHRIVTTDPKIREREKVTLETWFVSMRRGTKNESEDSNNDNNTNNSKDNNNSK